MSTYKACNNTEKSNVSGEEVKKKVIDARNKLTRKIQYTQYVHFIFSMCNAFYSKEGREK